MGLVDRLRNITIRVGDLKEIQLTLTRNSGFSVTIGPRFREVCFTDEDAAATIEALWSEALVESDRWIENVRRGDSSGSMTSSRSQRMAAAREDIENLEIEATSVNGRVTAAWDGSDDVMVLIRSGTLGRMTDSELEREVNEVLAAVLEHRREAMRQIRRNWFEMPIERAEKFNRGEIR